MTGRCPARTRPPRRRPWARRSRDTALVAAELARVGRARWTTPPVVKDFRLTPAMTAAWFRTDSARRVGETMLSFQTVHAGAGWLRGHAVAGVRYDSLTGTFVHDAAAPPTWARIYELPSLRPVMANRDGVPRYDFSELTDRRTGYGWFRRDAAGTLARYEVWARVHPPGGSAGRGSRAAPGGPVPPPASSTTWRGAARG